jgi:hypothetical protein
MEHLVGSQSESLVPWVSFKPSICGEELQRPCVLRQIGLNCPGMAKSAIVSCAVIVRGACGRTLPHAFERECLQEWGPSSFTRSPPNPNS